MGTVSENLLKCLLKEVGSGMVLTGCASVCLIDKKSNLIALFDASLYNLTDMSDPSAGKLYGFTYFKLGGCGLYYSGITLLTAHRCIEGSHLRDQGSFPAFRKRIEKIVLSRDRCNGILALKSFISYELTLKALIQLIVNGGACKLCGEIGILPCLRLLLVHGGLEAFLVNLKARFLSKLHGKLYGESESIIEIESVLTV